MTGVPKFLQVLVFCIAIPFAAAAQGDSPAASPTPAPTAPTASLDGVTITDQGKPDSVEDYDPPRMTLKENALAFSLLAFGLVVLTIQYLLLSKGGRKQAGASDIMLVYSVTLIIVGTMFLIVVGISSTQLAPAFGLYGTMVGYLLGKRSGTEASAEGGTDEK